MSLLINVLRPRKIDKKYQMRVPADLLIKDLFVFSVHWPFRHCYLKSSTCCDSMQGGDVSSTVKQATKTQKVFCGLDFHSVFRQTLSANQRTLLLKEKWQPRSLPAAVLSHIHKCCRRDGLTWVWKEGLVKEVGWGVSYIWVGAVGWLRNMSIIGSLDSCLTSTSSKTGPSCTAALIHTQMLIAIHSCPDQFELYGGDYL